MEEGKYDKIVGLIATIIVVILLNVEFGDKRLLESLMSSTAIEDTKSAAKNMSYGVLFLGWILRQHIGHFLIKNFRK